MNVKDQIRTYIGSQPQPKREDLDTLHQRICGLLPQARLWFLDGTDGNGKIVTNPNIGYGVQVIKYADGRSKEFYQVGISANTSGISVYIIGLDDKKYLAQGYGNRIGQASVTGYCIRFKALKDINVDVLEAAILDGVRPSTTS
ncbi:MAG: hypothetical protein JWP27_2744 [Flaviaesturariibacter sp.]|nr:hypothetical protein [Flaviaesturariibacter sp.]